MQPAKLGMVGEVPTVSVNSIDNTDLALADWCDKAARKSPNQSRKFLKIAEKLRELDHVRKYVKHYDSCISLKNGLIGPGQEKRPCTCGLDK